MNDVDVVVYNPGTSQDPVIPDTQTGAGSSSSNPFTSCSTTLLSNARLTTTTSSAASISPQNAPIIPDRTRTLGRYPAQRTEVTHFATMSPTPRSRPPPIPWLSDSSYMSTYGYPSGSGPVSLPTAPTASGSLNNDALPLLSPRAKRGHSAAARLGSDTNNSVQRMEHLQNTSSSGASNHVHNTHYRHLGTSNAQTLKPQQTRSHSQSPSSGLSPGAGNSGGIAMPTPRSPRITKLLGAVLSGSSPRCASTSGSRDSAKNIFERNRTRGNIVMVDGTFAEVADSETVTRPTSPISLAPTIGDDFSIISMPSPPSPMSFVHVVSPSLEHHDSGNQNLTRYPGMYDIFTSPTSGPEGTPNCTLFISPTKGGNLGPNNSVPGLSGIGLSGMGGSMRRSPKLSKAALGKLWGALSSPARRTRTKLHHANMNSNHDFDDSPLDGEEGELIDEACFIPFREDTGFDIIGFLPSEIALSIIGSLDLPSVLACMRVSRQWYAYATDPSVWRSLFYQMMGTRGWKMNERKARIYSEAEMDFKEDGDETKRRRMLSISSTVTRETLDCHWTQLGAPTRVGSPPNSNIVVAPVPTRVPRLAPLSLDWMRLFKTRAELDRRWYNGATSATPFEPRTMCIEGHADSVYCLEFDSRRLVTGSRDRTIKVWDIQTGKLRATLRAHAGSVLCLKFDKVAMARADSGSYGNDYEGEDDEDEDGGFMVSGSSDFSVLVWDLRPLWKKAKFHNDGIPLTGGPELVRRVLRGHTGGVLDLRINKQWIVSCSKDSLIRVWDRKSLKLAQTFSGHEGPVNAVGMQNGKVVSASGDGNLMLWDIETGMHLRTFEGHDRGLACIEFKGDLIISGSNDCKIKVWRASTGACLATLSGHKHLVRAMAYDAGTGRLVTGSYDKTVKVWDLKDPSAGRLVREFEFHDSHIFDVKFDVRRIVSTSHDQKVILLDFGEGLDTSLFP